MNKSTILSQVREYWEDSHPPKKFIPGKSVVPVSGAMIDANDIVSVVSTVLDGWFTEWTVSNKFSNDLAEYVGMKHALLCNSGSSSLLLAVSACVEKYNGKGKKIVTCATGFPTTIAPIIQCGCVPLFVDIDPITLNPRIDDIFTCLKRDDVVGVVQAHTLGLPYDAFSIMKYCILNDKFFVEDCADALGGGYGPGFRLGTYGTASTFSFFPAHHITSLDYSEMVYIRDRFGCIHLKQIGDFVDNIYQHDAGWECIAFNSNGKLSFSSITGVVKHPINEPLYKIRLQTGRSVVVSSSHNLFSLVDGNIITKKTSDFKIGDMVLAPNRLPNDENIKNVCYTEYKAGSWKPYQVMLPLSWELGRVLGYFVAEGSFNKTKSGNYSLVFSFGNSGIEQQYIIEVVHALSSVFGIKARVYKHRSSGMIVRCTNKGLYEFLSYWCGMGAENKKVPEFIFSAPDDIKRAFLDAYYNGDGCDHPTYGKHIGFSRDCVTVSNMLAIGLSYLLLQIGINPRYSVKNDASSRNFGDYISNTRTSYSVCYSAKSIFDAKGFRGKHLKSKRQIGDLTMVKILSIDEVAPTSDFVYDLSVSGKENFIAGIGCAVHNTGEGGAICTNDNELAEIIRSYRDWGRSCFCKPGQTNTCGKRFEQQFGSLPFGYDHKYVFERIGYNLKMTEMQAALGYSQLKKIDDFSATRYSNYHYLYTNLSDINEIHIPKLPNGSSPFGFPISVRNESSSKGLVNFLEERKIYTRPVFAGNIIRHPMMDGVKWESYGTLIGSDYVMDHTFWVGCHPGMTMEMLDWIIESIHDYYKGR